MVRNKVHQVQRKQIDSWKVCSKCPPPARTQACKRICHWSTASSISDCSKLCQMLSQLIDIMNSGLIHTLLNDRPWHQICDHQTHQTSILWIMPSGLSFSLMQWVIFKECIIKVWNVMFSFSLGSVSTLFRWGGQFYNVCVLCKTFPPVYNSAKIIKIDQDFPELWSQMYCHLFMVHSVLLLLLLLLLMHSWTRRKWRKNIFQVLRTW